MKTLDIFFTCGYEIATHAQAMRKPYGERNLAKTANTKVGLIVLPKVIWLYPYQFLSLFQTTFTFSEPSLRYAFQFAPSKLNRILYEDTH